MARLLKGDKMAEPPRGRRLSFKTKTANDRKPTVRVVRKTVPSNKVSAIASKFNAIVVEDEQKGRALLKKLHTREPGSVKATVQKFETLQGPKIVLVRKNSNQQQIDISDAVNEKPELESTKPKLQPKPNLDRKSQTLKYVKKDLKEVISKEKRFSLPKTQILDEILNESESTVEKEVCKLIESNKTEKVDSRKNNVTLNEEPNVLSSKSCGINSNAHKSNESNSIEEDLAKNETNENCFVQHNDKKSTSKELILPVKSVKPNSSFLWGVKKNDNGLQSNEISQTIISEEVDTDKLNLDGLHESSVDDSDNASFYNNDCQQLGENKENVDKLETPIVRTVDKKGYGKINVQANNSSLYRNILNSRLQQSLLINEIKEKVERKLNLDKKEKKERETTEEEAPKVIVNKTETVNTSFLYKTSSERSYELIGQDNYEVVDTENNYDVIKEDDEEAIYDDVHVNNERIYESIYNGKLQNDSDSSCEQNNSLYELRPPSQASSGGSGGLVNGDAPRSDTSDDWVDIELDSSEEQKEHIIVLQETPRPRGEGWSVKVRRQWSTRSSVNRYITTVAIASTSIVYIKYDETSNFEPEPKHHYNANSLPPITLGLVSLRDIIYSGNKYEVQEVTIFISSKEDSDSSSKHYELIENPDDDSALCDDFDDSSDSEFSVDNNYKPNGIEERLQPEVGQSEGIYSLMKEAGKKMRKTSSTIGKSLRRISRISKTTSAQDLLNGGNGMTRGKWPSFKKKPVQAKSTFYLNENKENTNGNPPPRPPPPTVGPDPRRLSLAVRPTSPPPPPPIYVNGDARARTSLYAECGLFEQNANVDKPKTASWYSDAGIYENSRPFDTASEHDSSQGSDIDLRFADEPLYQFYTESVAKKERSDDSSETGYEEIGENRVARPELRPSALDLVNTELHRTLWCQVPQVIASGILDTLLPERKKLQEAKFEVMTSEASYYKSLMILEKHFANSPILRDENVLAKVHHRTLFGNVSAVRKCSEAVLASLEKCWQESILLEGLSDVINLMAEEHFSAYVKYCKHQQAIERTLKLLKKTNPTFSEVLDTLQRSPKCYSLPFYSFVLLPLQRITRMPLLLDAILTKLTPSDSEYESCQLALARLNKIVHECNEAARQTERLEEMALVSRSLHFPPGIRPLPLLSASRWLVRSGDLMQVSLEPKTTFSRKLTAPKSCKLRLFLFTDYLVIAKKKAEDNFNVVTYCERNLVQMSDVEEAIPNRFLILLTLLRNHEGKTQEMVMCCGGESCRARWMSALSPPAPSHPGETLYEDWDCPQVSATHAYVSVQPDELSLQPGDVMNVLKKTVDGWYYGERTRDAEKGWFPGNHTVEILSSHVKARNLKQRYRLLALSSNFIQKQQQQMNKVPT